MIHRLALLLSLAAVSVQPAWAAEPAPKPVPAAQAAPAPRTARSVHLFYQAPAAKAFYQELVVEKSTPGSYFMACGFRDGYFGMQELHGGKKIVLFSVWDAGGGHDNARAVAADKRVEILYQAPDLKRINRFGGEGSGVQCLYEHDWKVGQPCRFLVKVVEVGGKPAYAAYFYLPEQKAWKHLATLRTPRNPERLGGLHSFVEDFRRDFKSAQEVRRAAFPRGAVLDTQGKWQPIGQAQFSASNSPTEAKATIDAGVADGAFYLQTGGDTAMKTKLWSRFEKPKDDAFAPPADLPE